MKAFTDLEQSKKLAEFLPLESADMHYATWTILDGNFIVSPNQGSTIKSLQEDYGNQIIPCWSLAALLNSVKYNTINLHYNDVRNDWIASCTVEHSTRYESGRALNPIDAVFEMILKLNELKLL